MGGVASSDRSPRRAQAAVLLRCSTVALLAGRQASKDMGVSACCGSPRICDQRQRQQRRYVATQRGRGRRSFRAHFLRARTRTEGMVGIGSRRCVASCDPSQALVVWRYAGSMGRYGRYRKVRLFFTGRGAFQGRAGESGLRSACWLCISSLPNGHSVEACAAPHGVALAPVPKGLEGEWAIQHG